MSTSNWIRQTHRWLSVVFMAAVVVTSVGLAVQAPAPWIPYLPLPPLFLLMFTGVYLFVLPYAVNWRGGGSAA